MNRATANWPPRVEDLPAPPPGKTAWPWTEGTPPLPETMPDGSPWPKVSIVTPSYNQGQFIEETIRSVLLQGYPNLEYIIIDGGSTDNSVEIIKKYEAWLTYWVSEPDRGQAHAINKGWRISTGDIIAYLNSDDVLASSALQYVVGIFLSHPDASVVYGDSCLIDSISKPIRELRSREYERCMLMQADYIHQPSAFVRREAVCRVGMMDESFHMCMDYDLWVRLALESCSMIYVPCPLSYARMTPNTKTFSQNLRYLEETLRVLDKVYGQSTIPEDVCRVKRVAYANAWRLGGVRYFDAGLRREAIGAIMRSLWWHPLPSWKSLVVSIAILLQSLIGVHWRSVHTLEKSVRVYENQRCHTNSKPQRSN